MATWLHVAHLWHLRAARPVGEGKRASASGLVETSASAELAQSDGDPLGGELGEDAGPARLDGDES